jgi:oligopeptide transport system ATP-binding protein
LSPALPIITFVALGVNEEKRGLRLNDYLLKTTNLRKYYSEEGRISLFSLGSKKSVVRALENIDLHILRNEVLGLVGESGCGKSTLGRTILRLEEPTSGEIFFENEDITRLSQKELKPVRKKMQIIFQDPASSLNPRKTVFEIISQPLKVHGLANTRREMVEGVADLLQKVGLEKDHMERYPHQFSGGQRQRICIARAIALKPNFLVADEVVSALDVSIQAQILNLLMLLKNDLNLSILFISHDLSVIRQISDRVAVMYLGGIMEMAPSESLFSSPYHPYTQALISAIPIPDVEVGWSPVILQGETPSPSQRPKGCPFHPRCLRAFDLCDKEDVHLLKISQNHSVACHLYRV